MSASAQKVLVSESAAIPERPALRENVWWVDVAAGKALLRTLTQSFEIPAANALEFLKVRTHCTGHNTPEEIATRSAVSRIDVEQILELFIEACVFRPSGLQDLDIELVRERFSAALALWMEEITIMCIRPEQATGDLLKGVWLEAWHESKHVCALLEQIYEVNLEDCLSNYLIEQKNYHNEATQILLELGFSKEEIETSIPLPSTRLIGFLLQELVMQDPSSVLLLLPLLGARMSGDRHFHAESFHVTDPALLDKMSNKTHDLIHAFILQTQEIKSYYTQLNGNYLPRQPVGFFAL